MIDKNSVRYGTIIYADGREENVEAEKFDLAFMQKVVGGYIEIVQTQDNFIVVDEEGKLKNKPINEKATMLYRMSGVNDFIVGDVLLTDKTQID